MNRRRLLRRITEGHTRNIRFGDFVDLVEGFGFELDRIKGSHRVYRHPRTRTHLNIQPERGQAKPYQVREFSRLIERYHLTLEAE